MRGHRSRRANPADAVVLTTELPDTYRLLGRAPRRPVALKPAPSAVVAHLGCRAVEDRLGHHNIVFGQAWEQTFRDIIDEGRVMGDPSLLVTRPTAGDPSLAPAGRDLLYVLAPAPNTVVGAIDWATVGPAYTEQIIAAVTDRLPAVGIETEVLHVIDPGGWARQGMVAGSTVRSRAHVRSDGAVQAGQHGARHLQRRAGRILDGAGRGGSHCVAVRAAGRRPRDRRCAPPGGPSGGAEMIGSELDAAGVRDPLLRESYRRCRALNAEYGRTFFLATRLLAPQQRPAVHALYGFARRADDILDDFDFSTRPAPNAAHACSSWPRRCSIRWWTAPTAVTSHWPRWCTPHADTASPGSFSTTFWPRCGWI